MSKQTEFKDLYKMKEGDFEKFVSVAKAAFKDYPKLTFAFPDKKIKDAAVELVIRRYGKFDFHYGVGYALDHELNEFVITTDSKEMDFSEERMNVAGCFDEKEKEIEDFMGPENMKKFDDFFEEFDEEEAKLTFPERFLYIDFVGVAPGKQHQGRGKKIIGAICREADRQKLPIMLFTNTEEDILFYEHQGFDVIGETSSEKFGFCNTYMVRKPA